MSNGKTADKPNTGLRLTEGNTDMRIVISSAGRRVYIVRWLQEALRQLQLSGDVYVLEHAPEAATVAACDGYRHMPNFTDDTYDAYLLDVIDELRPDLFISLNDHELTVLSQGLADQIRAYGTVVPVLSADAHRAVADKLVMSRMLQRAGLPTPETVVLSDAKGVYDLLEKSSAVIIKDRWGSGSSGLQRLTSGQAQAWLNTHATEHLDKLDNLIIQPAIQGTEYGLDIITPVRGGRVEGLLGRRKLGMRHGETSAAVTVDATQFQRVAAVLNATLRIQGTVDVDVMMADGGVPHVIDINPRFGGGYPFNHIAGADVPHFLLASTRGLSPRAGWNSYRHDYVGAKHEGIIGFDTTNRDTAQTSAATLKYVS